MRRIRWKTVWIATGLTIAGIAAWHTFASYLFLARYGLLDKFDYPLWQWGYYWWHYHKDPTVSSYLYWYGAIAAIPVVAMVAGVIYRAVTPGRLRPLRAGELPPNPVRAASSVHGVADWMTLTTAKSLWSGKQGIVIGEAYLPFKDSVADRPFREKNRSTWGSGGRAKLLIDECKEGPTHGVVVAGSGSFKTTATTIPTLFTWPGSVVVFDPSCQVGSMTREVREDLGQKVHMITPGCAGPNVLDCIDPEDNKLAELAVWEAVDWIGGEVGGKAYGENALFVQGARGMQAAILADMLWDPDLPNERKTLREFRKRLTTPENRMMAAMEQIAETSHSRLAVDQARGLMGVKAEKTFSGIYQEAIVSSMWLATEALVDMVSGNAFRINELRRGNSTVFVQIPMEVVTSNQGVARTVIGALIKSIYDADGQTNGRVLFLLDEARFLGRLKTLATALRAGRKYGLTIVTMWQDMGDIANVWGENGPQGFFANASWRMFAGVDDLKTAEWVSRECGSHGVITTSRTDSRSSGGGGALVGNGNNGRSRSTSWNTSEQKRPLIDPDEVRKMRRDEAIVLSSNQPAARIGRAIYFRRPEMAQRVGADRFRRAS